MAIDERTAVGKRRVIGKIRLIPEFLNIQSWSLDLGGCHHWCPIAPYSRIEVDFARPQLQFSGSGYHDANQGDEGLELAFKRWNWSRVQLANASAIIYDVEPRQSPNQQKALLFTSTGAVSELDPMQLCELPRTGWGIDRATRCDLGKQASVIKTLADTPFYARSLLETYVAGQRGIAMHESLDLQRFQQFWVQRMLPFRIRRKWGKPR